MSQARPLPTAIQREDRSGSWRQWTERLTRVASAAGQRYWAGVALAAAAGATFFVHLPVLDHYFFGDDFVSLADISLRSTPGYIKDLLLLRDMTPNWRFLTGLYYLGAYRAFGLNAFPYFLTSVLVHTGTATLIFWLVRRVVGGVWPAFLAAAFFGLSAAHVPTVGQVTAFNNVLAGFLMMLALVTLYEGLMRERLLWLLPASAVSFAAAIAANDSAAVLAPVFGLAVLWKVSGSDGWWREGRQWARLALLSAPYAIIGGAALLSFWACQCTQASRGDTWGAGDHIVGNVWILLGRLLYPIGMEAPGDVGPAHLAGGIVVAALALAMLLRGPALARVSVAFLALALVPYAPLHWALAPRYVYMAAIPFSILAALLFAEAARYGSRLMPAVPTAVGLVAVGVLALHGWQSVEQNASFEAETDDWRALVSALEERYPDLAEGSKVYVRGGPLTDGIWQFHVLPSVGEVVWGGVVIAAVPEETEEFCDAPGGDVHVLDYDGGVFTPVPDAPVVHCATPEFPPE
ncbi:MAG: hypothetical protein A2148_00055 [Chloroflexi bacterium RBG_16_68_14]|nr:MAG: hypothetical protein A2148_00055 [Chloroflexi bacterium RBG_16_68_14]